MYPSGRWRGFWEQVYWGRQAMHDLVLRFTNGEVGGSGTDIIGDFSFSGQYDTSGRVTLVKQYHGSHSVLYRGRYDGEGTIAGEWTIGDEWRGPFALSPEEFRVADDAPILDISAVPPGGTDDVGAPEFVPFPSASVIS